MLPKHRTIKAIVEDLTGQPLPTDWDELKALYPLGLCGECGKTEPILAGDYICIWCRDEVRTE